MVSTALAGAVAEPTESLAGGCSVARRSERGRNKGDRQFRLGCVKACSTRLDVKHLRCDTAICRVGSESEHTP